MRTCWVFDHPAHVRLLAPFLRAGTSSDIIIATDRCEVRQLMESSEGVLPRRQTVWVERPVGKGRFQTAWKRMRIVRKELKTAAKNGHRFERIIAVGAPLELRVAKKLGIPKRWYISDTEVNHLAHKLARNAATDAIFPTHCDESIDGAWLKKFEQKKVNIHRLNGLHGHVHLAPHRRPSKVSNPPRVVVRRLKGDGIHDGDELVPFPDDALDGLSTTVADEGEYEGSPWELDRELAAHDGVITQSVTLASEAALLGTPTLLISDAKRGFLDRLEIEGAPLFRWRGQNDAVEWGAVHAQFLAGLHLTDALESAEWPDAKRQLADLFNQ